MDAILEITDGSNHINLLSPNGIMLRSWSLTMPGRKGGGVFYDSPVRHGRRMVYYVDENAVETLELVIKGYSQNEVADKLWRMTALLDQGVKYWTSKGKVAPVYLKVRGPSEDNIRYALIKDWRIPEIGNVYAEPLASCPAVGTFTLILERGDWLSNRVDECECIGALSIYPYRPWSIDHDSATPTAKSTSYYSSSSHLVLERWVKPKKIDGQRRYIIHKGNTDISGGEGWSFELYNGELRAIKCFTTTNAISRADAASNGVELDQWVHLAAVYNDTTKIWRLFVNGQEVTTYIQQQAGSGTLVSDSPYYARLGENFSGYGGWTHIRMNPGAFPQSKVNKRCLYPTAETDTIGVIVADGNKDEIRDIVSPSRVFSFGGQLVEDCYPKIGHVDSGMDWEPALSSTTGDIRFTRALRHCVAINKAITLPSERNNFALPVSNHMSMIKLDYIYRYDGTSYSPNLLKEPISAPTDPDYNPANEKYLLFSSGSTTGKYVYFGVAYSASGAISGTFFNIVLNLTSDGSSFPTFNIAAETSVSGGEGFAPVTIWPTKITHPGVTIITITPPTISSNWSNTTINGKAGYYLRLSISDATLDSNIYQLHRHPYTCSWANIVLPKDQATDIVKKIIARMRVLAKSTEDMARLIVGTRSMARGSNFSAYINMSTQNLPSGIKFSYNATYGGTQRHPRYPGHYAIAVTLPTSSLSDVEMCKLKIERAVANEYIGRYRAFVRAEVTGGSSYASACMMRLLVSQEITLESTTYTVPTTSTYDVTLADTYAGVTPEYSMVGIYDMGTLEVPFFQRSDAENIGPIYLSVIMNKDATAGTVTVVLKDLILMPIDEFFADITSPYVMEGRTSKRLLVAVRDSSLYELDSVSMPWFGTRAIINSLTTKEYTATPLYSYTSSDFELRIDDHIAIWFLAFGKDSSGPAVLNCVPWQTTSPLVFGIKTYGNLRGRG